MTTYGILVFEKVEELDFAGPLEVFGASAAVRAREGTGTDKVVTIARPADHVHGSHGLQVIPHHTLDDHPPLDVLLVPGGPGAQRLAGFGPYANDAADPTVTGWIRKVAASADWVTSVCTGSLLLYEADLARGRRVATYWGYEDELEARGDVTVVRDARYVVDGNLVTSQGVSAGIDMALWLVGRIHGRDHSRFVRRMMQYEPAPPYMADEPLVA
jgi:transcriptional regulator GlxA family with amidase domain